MMAALRRWRHRMAHRVGWHQGQVVTWWSPDGRIMIGYRCDTCGALSGVHAFVPTPHGGRKHG